MNAYFPEIIANLRSERGLTQKKAAEDLGISQALLSHYEKGIRECGLDFLVNAANYYNVSTDYLLGRTQRRSFANELDPPPMSRAANRAAALVNANRDALTSTAFIISELLKLE